MSVLESMSDKELMLAEKSMVMDDPLLLVENGYLVIMTKAGALVKLELNYVQCRLLKRVRELMIAGRPVRIWILKARQTGISTLIQAMCYAMTSQREAVNSMVLAHDIDGSNYLFGMQKLYQEALSGVGGGVGEAGSGTAHLAPAIKHSNEKKLEFDKIHSQILIETSDNLKAGRAVTLRFVHLSECSRFRDLRTLMLSINQSVPNLAGTVIIGETTANGMDQFYDEWNSVKSASEAGLTDWETFFIPWFEVPEYRMELMDGKMYPIDAIEFATAVDRENFLMDERVMGQRYTLSEEQINWRRWCIVNNCNRKINSFNQEYPDSEKTAFISTGDNFFDKTSLARQEIVKPKSIGNIVKDGGRYIWRELGTGLFCVYEMPVRGGQYVVAGDPAEGLEHGDKSSAVILNKATNRTVCVYNHNIPPDRFEEDLIKMGHFYNDALVGCENKGYGYSVNQGLYSNYGRVYKKVKTGKGFKEQTMEIGWNCVAPDTLILTSDFIYKKANEITTNDEIIAFEENLPERINSGRWGYRHRNFNYQNVLKINKFKAKGIRIILEDGRKIEVSNNHPFFAWTVDKGEFWIEADKLYNGLRLKTIPIWEPLRTFEAGRLSGLLCGEGYITSTFSKKLNRYTGLRMHIAQTEGLLAEEIMELWKKCGFDVKFKYIQERKKATRPHKPMVYSGLNKASSVFIALGQLQPKRLIRKLKEKNYLSAKTTSRLDKLKIIKIEEIGEIDVIGIETSGHTLITNGILSHNTNSVSRPTMLAQLAEEILNGSTDLLDKDLIAQCWTFINNIKRGQPEAERGKADDLVMARAIAGMMRNEQPFKDKFIRAKKVRKFRGLSGY